MQSSIKLLDVIALTIDLPEHNLQRGQVGTVVERLGEGKAFEVEFSDANGQTFESVSLDPEHCMVLYFEPASPEFQLEPTTM